LTIKENPPVYISRVRIERGEEKFVRLSYLPAETEPVLFGTHGAVAEHYGRRSEDIKVPHATTLDYVVAATGG
jgi:sirohydrochlorin ferrochelatase